LGRTDDADHERTSALIRQEINNRLQILSAENRNEYLDIYAGLKTHLEYQCPETFRLEIPKDPLSPYSHRSIKEEFSPFLTTGGSPSVTPRTLLSSDFSPLRTGLRRSLCKDVNLKKCGSAVESIHSAYGLGSPRKRQIPATESSQRVESVEARPASTEANPAITRLDLGDSYLEMAQSLGPTTGEPNVDDEGGWAISLDDSIMGSSPDRNSDKYEGVGEVDGLDRGESASDGSSVISESSETAISDEKLSVSGLQRLGSF